ncbi:hypothetical protein [Leptospira andrefontaineae]|uniref:Lipoprotein n=1 Tax=Leptospira andrefontaineae TaxID=2484976 RepID=A0A4R9H953_9LEPT|nr:hypothetical protein [Leptospira andrefontaineae]TGK42713.1 hypothetical protein EHO65_04700 [Leptospira andrefontaineae]
MKYNVYLLSLCSVLASCSEIDPGYDINDGKQMGCIAILVSYNACTDGSSDPARQNACLTESLVAGGSCFAND